MPIFISNLDDKFFGVFISLENYIMTQSKNNDIPEVDQYRYLGMWYSKINSFIPYMKYLKIKCDKAIQLLKSKLTLNGLPTTLPLLGQIQLDYDCFIYIYRTARKSHIKELNAILHQGLKLTIGTVPISLVESLFTEANESLQPICCIMVRKRYTMK